MEFFIKTWLLVALVFLGSCGDLANSEESEGRGLFRTYTVRTTEDVEEAMNKFIEESGACQKASLSSKQSNTASTSKPKPTSTEDDPDTSDCKRGENQQENSASQTCRTICSGHPTKYNESDNYWIGDAAKVRVKGENMKIFCGCTCRQNITASMNCTRTIPRCSYVVVQRRVSSYSFNKDRGSYEKGFGNVSENYWIGLEKLHALTSVYPKSTLAIFYNVEEPGRATWKRESAWRVKIGSKHQRYELTFEGTDSNLWENKTTFEVRGSDQEKCGSDLSGWWHEEGSTVKCTPNSEYIDARGVTWQSSSDFISSKFIEIRLYLHDKAKDLCPSDR